MNLEQIGHEIRRSRLSLGMTQAQLAAAVKITRTRLIELENGLIKDLGVRKIEAILDRLGLALLIDQTPQRKPPASLRLASTGAPLWLQAAISAEELRRMLLAGKSQPSDTQMRACWYRCRKLLVHSLIQQLVD